MKQAERIVAMADGIHEILTRLPAVYKGKARRAVMRQLEISSVAIFENLCSAFDVYGGTAEQALKESIKALARNKIGRSP